MDLNIEWNEKNYGEFIDYLKRIGEEKYRSFQKKLIDTKYEILGIKLPQLRQIANNIFKYDYSSFLKICSDDFYECVMLKGLVIAKIKNIQEVMLYFNSYVDAIDNWAISDTFCNSLKIVSKNKDYFLKVIDSLIKTNEQFKVRVGFILLLSYYIEDDYLDLIFQYIDEIKSEAYYINMACAWLLCEVFIKYQDRTLKYLENNHLNKFTINKAISKIRDSYRVEKEMKDYILKFKKEK